MKALVIDDSRAMRTIIGGILRGIGFEVVEAGNGKEGLLRLDTGLIPELAMVDWNMPEMNGLEFVTNARKRPELGTMRIIMVTTETEIGRMAEALAQGVDEYVMKPFTREAILEKLERLAVVCA